MRGNGKGPRPPRHLSLAARKWWSCVLASYQIEDHLIPTLTAAAEAWDRKEQAREVLAKEGLTVECRDGTKTHPCVAVERDSRLAFLRAVRELRLDPDQPDDVRLPRIGGMR
jgi:phage terminase small subunit